MAKILIVEDDTLNREMIARRLTWEGHTVITATNGEDSIVITEAECPDLVLMDVGLPLLSGWQASRQIKAIQATCHIPIIALTAFATDDDRERSLSFGCDDFETKPIDFQQLLEKIAVLLNKHESCNDRMREASL